MQKEHAFRSISDLEMVVPSLHSLSVSHHCITVRQPILRSPPPLPLTPPPLLNICSVFQHHQFCVGSILGEAGECPMKLSELQMSMTRESPLEAPQLCTLSWSLCTGSTDLTGVADLADLADGTDLAERGSPLTPPRVHCLSRFPHPYPSIRDATKQLLRCGILLCGSIAVLDMI